MENKPVQINIVVAEANLILKALGKLPTEETALLFFKIKQQCEEQLKPKEEIKEEA